MITRELYEKFKDYLYDYDDEEYDEDLPWGGLKPNAPKEAKESYAKVLELDREMHK